MTDLMRSELVECGYGAAEISAFERQLAAGSEPVVSHTPNGRNILLTRDGFSVQPRDDNYWMTVPSIDAAMDAYENPSAHRAEY